MDQSSHLGQEELEGMIGSLVRTCARYDQGLYRMVHHLRMGQNIRDQFRTWALEAAGEAGDDDVGKRAAPPPIEDSYEDTRRKLIRKLTRELTGNEHLPRLTELFTASRASHEVRDIVVHWDLTVLSRSQIVATSFIATIGLDHKATRLMEKYRTPPRKPHHLGTDFHDRTATLSFDQIVKARDDLRQISAQLMGLTGLLASTYVQETNFPKPRLPE